MEDLSNDENRYLFKSKLNGLANKITTNNLIHVIPKAFYAKGLITMRSAGSAFSYHLRRLGGHGESNPGRFVQQDASERMRTRVSSQILNRGSGCENGGENGGNNGREITGGENDGLERIDGNRP
ncbi:hypothetical protein YC2023_035885 [Brassica napus]